MQIVSIAGVGEVEFPDDMSDAEIAAAAKRLSAPKVSQAEAGIRGGLQGASLGWSDELAAPVDAAFPGLSRAVNPDVLAAAPAGADYAMRRDAAAEYYRLRNKAAAAEHPGTYLAGELAGGAATIPAGGAARGVGLLSRMGSAAKTGALIGGAAGLGHAEGDAADQALAALGGAGGGALIGGAIPAAGALASRGSEKLGAYLQRRSIEQGRKALSGIGTSLSARKPISEEAVQQALESGAIRPLGTVAGTAERLGTQAEALGAEYGTILEDLAAAGVEGPNAVLLAQRIRQMAQDAAKTSIGSPRPKMLTGMASELETMADPTPFASKRLGLMQTEKIKRGLQQEANYSRLTDRAASETKKDMAAIMRRAIEDEVQAQAAKAPEAAAAFEPVKQRLSRTMEALKAAEEGAARASRRKAVSLTDTIVGTGAGAATGSPALGLLGALAHGVADRRLASTDAAVSAALGRALGRSAPEALTRNAPGAAVMQFSQSQALADLLRRFRVAPAGADADPGQGRE